MGSFHIDDGPKRLAILDLTVIVQWSSQTAEARAAVIFVFRVSNSIKATISAKLERSTIWQQIGNTTAHAAALRLQCKEVRLRRK